MAVTVKSVLYHCNLNKVGIFTAFDNNSFTFCARLTFLLYRSRARVEWVQKPLMRHLAYLSKASQSPPPFSYWLVSFSSKLPLADLTSCKKNSRITVSLREWISVNNFKVDGLIYKRDQHKFITSLPNLNKPAFHEPRKSFHILAKNFPTNL